MDYSCGKFGSFSCFGFNVCRQTGRQTDRQTDRHTDGQTHRRTDRLTHTERLTRATVVQGRRYGGGTGALAPLSGKLCPRRGILIFFVGAGQITYWQERTIKLFSSLVIIYPKYKLTWKTAVFQQLTL